MAVRKARYVIGQYLDANARQLTDQALSPRSTHSRAAYASLFVSVFANSQVHFVGIITSFSSSLG